MHKQTSAQLKTGSSKYSSVIYASIMYPIFLLKFGNGLRPLCIPRQSEL